jgi:Ras-related protein Rab-2A
MADYEKVYKLVMLGDEAVGKTSLIMMHTEHRFEESYKMTIGTDISAKLVQVDEKHGSKTNVYLILWDIGGQPKYAILKESYLRGASGALLVFDLTNKTSFHHIYEWLDDLHRICGKIIPAFLLGNKADLPTRQVTSEEASKTAASLGMEYLETSAKLGQNVDKAFNRVVDLILHHI